MDKLFVVFAARHGYTPNIYGIFNDKELADKRGKEVANDSTSNNYYSIVEITLNDPIDYEV